jgi:glutamyl-tRNA reductase
MATKKQELANDNEIIIPVNIVELQEFCQNYWELIFEKNEHQHVKIYNEAARQYNNYMQKYTMKIISNLKQQIQMENEEKVVAAKKAAKKAAPKKVAKKAVKKVAKKAAKKTAKVAGAPSQKTQIVELAGKGKTIDQIVEATKIPKANVAWYFSKLQLGKSKAKK